MGIVYFSTKSKKTKKQRAKDKDAWKAYCEKYGLKESKDQSSVRSTAILTPVVNTIYRRETKHIPSRGDGIGSAVKQNVMQYTGDKMLGVAAMHKSNLVPIFSDEQAKETATMRRN